MERDILTSLVTRAQAGDSNAMNELFANFYNDVYYFAYKTVKDSDLACDITQETFLEIIRTIGNLKEPAAFVTWMKQITYHQCTRYFKKKKEVLVDEDEDGNSIFDTLSDESEGSIPAEVYEKEEFRSTILNMINELTEEQRSAVMMYYFDEMSVGQIADIQGVSEGTVKSRLNYARKGIKKSVEDYEKKHNIKLHSFSFLPLFLLFFGKELMPAAKAAEIGATVSAAAGAAGTGTAAVIGSTAAATAKTGLAAKIAGLPVVTKIIAGVTAAAIAIGGGTAAIYRATHDCKDEDRNCVCDICHVFVHQRSEAPESHGICGLCGSDLGIVDEDHNLACDVCAEPYCGPTHNASHLDHNGDGYCDFSDIAYDRCGELTWDDLIPEFAVDGFDVVITKSTPGEHWYEAYLHGAIAYEEDGTPIENATFCSILDEENPWSLKQHGLEFGKTYPIMVVAHTDLHKGPLYTAKIDYTHQMQGVLEPPILSLDGTVLTITIPENADRAILFEAEDASDPLGYCWENFDALTEETHIFRIDLREYEDHFLAGETRALAVISGSYGYEDSPMSTIEVTLSPD